MGGEGGEVGWMGGAVLRKREDSGRYANGMKSSSFMHGEVRPMLWRGEL